MFEEILARTAKALDNGNIPYMIIGGQAVLLYGEPRITRDIDITLGIDTSRLGELLEIAEKNNLKTLPENIEEFVKETMVLPTQEESTGIRVDFIFSFSPYERDALKRARGVSIEKYPVRFASAEDVIIHKLFAGRPRDIEDTKNILLKNPSLDTAYIQKWLQDFDQNLPEKSLLRDFQDILKSVSSG